MARSVVLLVNPAAGGGRGKSRAAALAPLLVQAGAIVTVRVAHSPEESADAAHEIVTSGADVLGVVGGDGTVNLVLPALRGARTALAIIPTGTGDDNARTFGHDLKGETAMAEMIASGPVRDVDLGIATADGVERPFLSVLCAGFDSAVNARANALTWPGGQARYVRAVLETLYSFSPIGYTLSIDGGEPRELNGMLMAVGNGPTYGGGMKVCVGADPADGLLDVTILKELSKAGFLRAFPKVYSGTFTDHPAVEQLQARSLRIQGDAVAFADGEHFGDLPVDIRLEPGALRVVSPSAD